MGRRGEVRPDLMGSGQIEWNTGAGCLGEVRVPRAVGDGLAVTVMCTYLGQLSLYNRTHPDIKRSSH